MICVGALIELVPSYENYHALAGLCLYVHIYHFVEETQLQMRCGGFNNTQV